MELRPYQEAAVNSILGEWEQGHQHTLLVLPTGTGKTVVFSKVVEEEVSKGEKALILAHRGELLEQASDKLYQTTGLTASLEKAESTSIGSYEIITFGEYLKIEDRMATKYNLEKTSLYRANDLINTSFRVINMIQKEEQ